MHKISAHLVFIIFLLAGFLAAFDAQADRATSTNFIIDSGVINSGGENATSASFLMPQAFGEPALGLSTSSFFRILGGFLSFPFVSDPVLSASAGQEQVVVSWTASEGFLGFNVSGYDVGTGITADGETFENVGNVLTFTKTGLTGGTTYFFKVRAKDEFGEVIAVSNEMTAVPTAAGAPPAPGGAGGAGRGVARVPVPPFEELLEKILVPVLPEIPCFPKTDLNCDGKINLSDFSIFLYLMPQPQPEPADFNEDKSVDIRDLSVLFFDWTDKMLAFSEEKPFLTPQFIKESEQPKKSPYFAVITESIGLEPLKSATGAGLAETKPGLKITAFFLSLMNFIAGIFESISRFIQDLFNF